MRAFIVFDHPYHGSLCRAALEAAVSGLEAGGHTADVADLYADRFDPILRTEDLARYNEGTSGDPMVGDYRRRIDAADHVVFVFPVWWQVMPALSKGFLDKVLTPGWAFEVRPGEAPRGLLGRLRVTYVTVMGSPDRLYRRDYGNPLHGMFAVGTWGFVGVPEENVTWLNLPDIDNSTADLRRSWLATVKRYFQDG